MNDELIKKFTEDVKRLNISLSEPQQNTFQAYLHFLKKQAQKHNVTGIKNTKDIVEKHFFDSLTIAQCFALPAGAKMLDAGTGAGFPGLPLKIVFPELKLSLLETSAKKALFLKNLLEELSLDADILQGRAETLARESHRETFELVTARAFGHFSETLECTLPFVGISGKLILYQGKTLNLFKTVEKAQTFIQTLGGKVAGTFALTLPWSHAERTLLVLEKVTSTPEKFPRKPGIPRKRPLFK